MVIKKRLSCPIASTSGLLFMIVLTLFRGKRTSFERSGEFAATVVGVLLADSSATLGFVLPSAIVNDAAVSETNMSVFQSSDILCMNRTEAQLWVAER